MNSIYLVSTDNDTISEIQTLAAVAKLQVHIRSDFQDVVMSGSQIIILDSTTLLHDELTPEIVNILQSHICLVVTWNNPGPHDWKIAALTHAQTIITLPDGRATLSSFVVSPQESRASLISVMPMVGGAGASTLSGLLAHHLGSAGFVTALIDGDDQSAGLELLTGTEKKPGTRWQDLANNQNIGKLSVFEAIPCTESFALLSHTQRSITIKNELLCDVVTNVSQTCDFVVMDWGKGSHLSHVNLVNKSEQVCLVTTNSLAHIATAQKWLTNFGKISPDHGLVVRQLPGCSLDPMTIAETLNVPLWATFLSSTRLVEQLEQGIGFNAIHVAATTRATAHLASRLTSMAGHNGI